MGIRYNGSKIIPAPFVGINKNIQKTGAPSKVGSLFTLSVQGTIVACKGSPDSNGTFWTAAGYPPDEIVTADEALSSLLHKQEAIRELFAEEGKLFLIEPLDGTPAVSGYMRVNEIDFPADHWINQSKYTITLETDELYGFPGAEDAVLNEDFFVDDSGNKIYLQEVDEDWGLEFNEQPENEGSAHSFRLSHNVSAVGKQAYDATGLISEPWKQARRWVSPRLGIDNNFLHATSGLNLPAYYGGFNHARNENTNEQNGSYSVSETWVISSGNIFEDFTVSTSTANEDAKTTVSIEGQITGMDTRNSDFEVITTKYSAATTKFDAINPTTIFTRASSYSGIASLNSSALSTTIGRNPVAGTINYSFGYNDRPGTCIAGALSEQISIVDVDPADVFATVPVMGRNAGPILQNISTKTESTRTVSIDVTVAASEECPNSVSNVANMLSDSPSSAVDTIIQAFEDHLVANQDQVFKNQDTNTWMPWDGKYSRTVGWTYQSC